MALASTPGRPIWDEEDRAFITRLFLQYRRLMYSQVFQIVGDIWVTEDLVQDVLVKLMEKVGQLRGKDEVRLTRYLAAACRNRARNHLRAQRARRRADAAQQLPPPEHGQGRAALEGGLILQEDVVSLDRIWAQLDSRSRFLLKHRYILEEPAREIGRQLGIQAASVRMGLSRARRRAYQLMLQEERRAARAGGAPGRAGGEPPEAEQGKENEG